MQYELHAYHSHTVYVEENQCGLHDTDSCKPSL